MLLYKCQETYLEDSDCCPEKVIKMFPVAFALRMVGNYLRAGTVPLCAVIFDELAKLTTE